MKCRLFLVWTFLDITCAFVPQKPHVAAPALKPSSSRLHMDAAAIDPDLAQQILEARAAFALCFFGALGTAAVGRTALPQIWEKFSLTQSLKGKGPTLGGETIGLSPIALYPDDIGVEDIRQVINNELTPAEIVEQFPVENSWPGYLTYEAFAQANTGANPLAVRGVFESLAVTSEIVAPSMAQQSLNEYRKDLTLMKDNLTKTKALSYFAAVTLVFLLGLVDCLAVYHFYRGWFPEWPGAQLFPIGIFDPDVGFPAIPNYWVWEIEKPN